MPRGRLGLSPPSQERATGVPRKPGPPPRPAHGDLGGTARPSWAASPEDAREPGFLVSPGAPRARRAPVRSSPIERRPLERRPRAASRFSRPGVVQLKVATAAIRQGWGRARRHGSPAPAGTGRPPARWDRRPWVAPTTRGRDLEHALWRPSRAREALPLLRDAMPRAPQLRKDRARPSLGRTTPSLNAWRRFFQLQIRQTSASSLDPGCRERAQRSFLPIVHASEAREDLGAHHATHARRLSSRRNHAHRREQTRRSIKMCLFALRPSGTASAWYSDSCVRSVGTPLSERLQSPRGLSRPARHDTSSRGAPHAASILNAECPQGNHSATRPIGHAAPLRAASFRWPRALCPPLARALGHDATALSEDASTPARSLSARTENAEGNLIISRQGRGSPA
ncbi:hypothetical protein Q5P01_000841 [Channa striata]|uniref:Uncharacterized protein n=1 Tax=Channa striata TaxID=64152 RepID=A0AA88ID07_CHASR|nr:hypothetical protein Q5P01_000841 [Channa striata]